MASSGGYWRGQLAPQGRGAGAARVLSEQSRFFHWFLEFPEIMDRGGFDCILGNPPYLGGQALSGTYGHAFCECMRWRYAPTGLSDLVVFFLRRIHGLLRDGGFTAIITTNSIVDGDVRKDGLEQVVAAGAPDQPGGARHQVAGHGEPRRVALGHSQGGVERSKNARQPDGHADQCIL